MYPQPFFYDLDPEELEQYYAIERGEYSVMPNSKELKEAIVAAAHLTSAKAKTINIRVSELDLHRLKVKATKEGIPYQTLITSILHKSL